MKATRLGRNTIPLDGSLRVLRVTALSGDIATCQSMDVLYGKGGGG